MYGNKVAVASPDGREILTLNTIIDETRKGLISSLSLVDDLLRIVRGSQPSGVGEQTGKAIERTIFGDAKEIRSHAYELADKLNDLRNLLG